MKDDVIELDDELREDIKNGDLIDLNEDEIEKHPFKVIPGAV